jgi:hypothetical protein
MAVVDILKGSRLWLLDAVCSDSQYLFFMAKKRKKKQPFGGAGGSASVSSAAVGRAAFDAERQGGVFNFFRDFGVRETIESVIVAIILAMLFRGFEAEAFIIPTGSMAPSLQGQHLDLDCAQSNRRKSLGFVVQQRGTGREYVLPNLPV